MARNPSWLHAFGWRPAHASAGRIVEWDGRAVRWQFAQFLNERVMVRCHGGVVAALGDALRRMAGWTRRPLGGPARIRAAVWIAEPPPARWKRLRSKGRARFERGCARWLGRRRHLADGTD